MAFIRNREEERTGYQNGLPLEPFVDFQNDFVMCYRFNAIGTFLFINIRLNIMKI